MEKPFEVAAGNLENNTEARYLLTGQQYEKNYKYINTFATLDEALEAQAACKGYDFVELVFIDKNGKRWSKSLT